MRWYWSPIAGLIAVTSALFGVLGWYAWQRRRMVAALSLSVALLAAGWWSLAYALELSSGDLRVIEFWGHAKYLGIVLLPPAWLVFILQYTDRARVVTPRLLAGLAVMPVLTLALLANDATRDLIRYYEPFVPGESLPSAQVGPLFWIHLVYSYTLLLGATILLAATFLRLSRFYGLQSLLLLLGATLPMSGNLMYNLRVPPFEYVDPTPFAFLICFGLLIGGVLRFGLLELVPIAREAIVERMSDSVIVLDVHGRVIDLNPAAERLLGCAAEAAVGQAVADVLPSCADALERHAADGTATCELQVETSGHPRDFDLALSTIHGPRLPAGHLLVLRDVTERKLAEERLSRLAHFDTLTGLPNRKLFGDRLEAELSRASDSQRQMALLFCDLDHFKRINDTLGHGIGDLVLRQVADRLRTVLRQEDTIARLGGDEFVILLPHVERTADAELVANLLVQALTAPVRVGVNDLYLTMSIGVCLYPKDGLDAPTLMRHADSTMYRAKAHGRNRFELHSPESDDQLLEELQLEQELRGAHSRGELEVWYQPALNLASGTVIGMEATVRWRHPRHGLLMPSQFFPVVWETELAQEIDRWVLSEACWQACAWQQGADRQPVAVMVGLSARQFQDLGLSEEVARILWDTGLPPSSLVLQISEAVMVHDPETVLHRLTELQRLGVVLAVDDYGTGSALIGQLRDLPLRVLKIDQAFVSGLGRNRHDEAAIASMIGVGHDLGITLIAKGVEHTTQRFVLERLNCDGGQGPLFSRPLPVGDAGRYLAAAWTSPV